MKDQVKSLFDALMCNYDFPAMFAEGLAEFLYDEGYREQVKGKWIDVPDCGGSGWQISGKPVQPKQCSVCGDVYSKAYNYCPRCGAKMSKE